MRGQKISLSKAIEYAKLPRNSSILSEIFWTVNQEISNDKFMGTLIALRRNNIVDAYYIMHNGSVKCDNNQQLKQFLIFLTNRERQ